MEYSNIFFETEIPEDVLKMGFKAIASTILISVTSQKPFSEGR